MEKIGFKKVLEKIGGNPILASSLVFVLASVIVMGLTLVKYGYNEEFYRNILVEAHGMLYDILVIGVIIFALHKVGEKKFERKLEIQRYQEEIDDFRHWESEEAMYRIVGDIKRLNRAGISKINLSYCYLVEAKLGLDLQERIDWVEGRLSESERKKRAKGYLVSMGKREEWKANLRGAELWKANLKGANLMSIDLRDAKLYRANLQRAKLVWTDLEGADLKEVNLQEADLRQANCLKVEQLSKVKTLYKAKLEPKIFETVKKDYPYLFEKPIEK